MAIEGACVAIENQTPLARGHAHGPVDERLMAVKVAGEKEITPTPDEDFVGIVLGD